tara:strand:- start:27887 stop:29041 length:1155 start_codon:yes stop_codon:yes gene_type:complete
VTSFQRSIASYEAQFGSKPKWVAHAPGRVNLIGEHIDYNDGFVLPAAIDRRLSIAASPVNHPEILIYSEQEKQQVHFSLDAPLLPSGKWTDYVIGVVEYWRRLETRPVGLKLAIASDVPYGSGLSSSAALEMAFATLIGEVWGLELDPVAKALKCQQVESDFVGMPCGIMDQFVVGLARKDYFLKIDCQSNTHEFIKAGEQFPALLIINSNVKHALTDGGYASRRAQCESALFKLGSASWRSVSMEQLSGSAGKLDEVELRRGRHVISEMHRTLEACERIQASDYQSLGELLYQSHFSLRDDFEVSCPELDWIVNRMQSLGGREGVYGCRITGGGFGGCAVSLVDPEAVKRVIQIIAHDYLEAFGVSAGFFLTQPSAGCALSKL